MVSSHRPDRARPRLHPAQLAGLDETIARPRYDRESVSAGIVHIGLGAFARAHLAVYTEEALAAGASDWGILGVNINSPNVEDALKPQGGLYTLLVRDAARTSAQVIGSVIDVMTASRDPRGVLDALVRPSTRIVSLTITEKGYGLDAATGALDERHPLIVAELATPDAPSSALGFIVEALRRRRAEGVAPFTVLSCDNLAHNGAKARAAVSRLASLRDPEFGRFVEAHVAFPSTMVDRITPATGDSDRVEAAELLGLEDAAPVVAEPFRQWVIEDRFSAGRPRWEIAGALMVDDVEPYEVMKLRCLNGAHSTLAYLSVVAGITTISDAMNTPGLAELLRLYWRNDIFPTLRPVAGVDLDEYVRSLEQRFRNPAIRHLALQISADGSQKLPQRLVGPALDRLRAGAPLNVIPLSIAAWMRFLLARTEAGASYAVADPLAERLTGLARENERSGEALTRALLGVREIFPAELAENQAFSDAVARRLGQIMSEGVAAAVRSSLR